MPELNLGRDKWKRHLTFQTSQQHSNMSYNIRLSLCFSAYIFTEAQWRGHETVLDVSVWLFKSAAVTLVGHLPKTFGRMLRRENNQRRWRVRPTQTQPHIYRSGTAQHDYPGLFFRLIFWEWLLFSVNICSLCTRCRLPPVRPASWISRSQVNKSSC